MKIKYLKLTTLPLLISLALASAASASFVEMIGRVQPKIVKIYGAGGYGLEAYQTGILISPEGHVLTAYSSVLDTDYIIAVLADGRLFQAKLVGADPRLEVAVLKLKVEDANFPCFDLDKAVKAVPGARVLAFSNLFGVAVGDEPASVQRGTISTVAQLEARSGMFETPYRGPIYVLDVTTSNPGAAGGALVNRNGDLVGMLGKELRNALNNTWLNYAVPIEELRQSVDEIRAGKFRARRNVESEKKPERPLNLAALGIVMVPDVLERTPPYVEHVRSGFPAAKAGLRSDDLILLLDGRLIQSCRILLDDLQYVDYESQVKLTVLRGQELLEFTLQAGDSKPPKKELLR